MPTAPTPVPYRYPHFTRRLLTRDMDFEDEPRPGETFPDFELSSIDGGTIRKEDLAGKPALLSLASRTCPLTRAAVPALKRLYKTYGGRVRFVSVYVREAHPGERVPQPETMEAKLENARCFRDRESIPWPIGVDGIEGELHRQLGGQANAAYLLDPAGRVRFRALFSSDERGLRRGLAAAIDGGPAGESRSRVLPLLAGVGAMREALAEGGAQANRDVLRQAPPMYALGQMAGLFRPLPPLARGLAAVAVVGIAGVAAFGLLLRRSRKED